MYSLKYRPPLVVFLLCLLALSIATFYYGYLIDKSAKGIGDNDIKYDWLNMLKHFNALDNCLEFTDVEPAKNRLDHSQYSSVRALVSFENTNYLRQFQKINGYLLLDGWLPSCTGKKHPTPTYIEVEFDLPQFEENDTLIDVCVTLTGYSEYLPDFVQPNCEVPTQPNKNTRRGTLITKSKHATNDNFCTLGQQLNMAFYLNGENNIANVLKDDTRKKIVVRLMWCGSLLVVVKVTIIIFILFYDILTLSPEEKKQMENDYLATHLI